MSRTKNPPPFGGGGIYPKTISMAAVILAYSSPYVCLQMCGHSAGIR